MVAMHRPSIISHPIIEKSLRLLRAMGLKVNVFATADNEAYIFIELDSVLRLIERQMQYPNKRVNFEEPYIVIYVWRGQI